MNHPILTAIDERRTINLFDPARTLSEEQVAELAGFATRAPSSFNLQNYRFIAAHTPEARLRLRRIAWNQAKVTDAGVTFVVVGRMTDHEETLTRLRPTVDAGIMPERVAADWAAGAKSLYHEQPWRQRDEAVRSATFAAATMIFAAHAMGLGAGPMSGFDQDAVSAEFGLAPDEFPVMLLAIGHPAPGNWPQKARRPVADVLDVV
ncbi:nitroreductase [Catenuloplanes nepalensis]|uniref:Nitroreductase n=1 Tax=Catenuloplanes nepalensis TaxID=587533 RepID=A0ABT9MS44_9ACTN|nr:nitroreductase family protein [Catenuloplanes nepalensis]MDP9794235.1 nitroreductase [Catenuloplanes nepalensis]